MVATAKDQQGRNYPWEKKVPHGPMYQTHTFPIHAATARKVLKNVQRQVGATRKTDIGIAGRRR